MSETLLSVGIDIGTATTQLVFSRLKLENRASPFSVPRVAITDREICYCSPVHRTPLCSDRVIDAGGVRALAAEEYRRSATDRNEVRTGAVIITGETARKDNAREVLRALSEFAGEFVVATAGPDLESILAARGAGADEYSREHHCRILHTDIGGGTANLALYEDGQLKATGCLDVGGRLLRFSPDSTEVEYVAPVLSRLKEAVPAPGQRTGPAQLQPVIGAMVGALEQAAGLRDGRDLLEHFLTAGTTWEPVKADVLSFSGGVADCVYDRKTDWMQYGDLGVLLGAAIRESSRIGSVPLHRGRETIRATVVGAGSHSTELSGSTIYHRGVTFPLKNLPVLKLTEEEERGAPARLVQTIRARLRWFSDEGGLTQTALMLPGEEDPDYSRVRELADSLCAGLQPLLEAGLLPVVAMERDMAKVLGQAMAARVPGPLLCLDGVHMENGDYLDVGMPVAHGNVLPIVIKTLAFNK